jgi:hypothetical protein
VDAPLDPEKPSRAPCSAATLFLQTKRRRQQIPWEFAAWIQTEISPDMIDFAKSRKPEWLLVDSHCCPPCARLAPAYGLAGTSQAPCAVGRERCAFRSRFGFPFGHAQLATKWLLGAVDELRKLSASRNLKIQFSTRESEWR